jgi:hypothetical protein
MRKATEKKLEKKPVKERAYRILAQNLQDILYEEFNRYKYWKMNTLQERLQQPTSWIRQNLKAIAVREETGPYQSKLWRVSIYNDLLIDLFIPNIRLLEAARQVQRCAGGSRRCRRGT